MTSSESELIAIERELDEAARTPREDRLEFLEGLLARARALPDGYDTERLIHLLINIAFATHLHCPGTAGLSADPGLLAVGLAEKHGNRHLLRRALSVQGLISGTTGSVSAGLQNLSRALDLAVELCDGQAEAAAWNNISVVYAHAMLFSESRHSATRAIAVCDAHPAMSFRRGLLARSLHVCALAELSLGDIAGAVAAGKRARLEAGQPTNVEEQVLVTAIEGTLAQSLIRLGRLQDAEPHVNAAMAASRAAGSIRAQITANTTSGLFRVFQGETETGLAQLEASLVQSRDAPGFFYEALQASIRGYEHVGRTARALELHRLLISSLQQTQLRAMRQPSGSIGGSVSSVREVAAQHDALDELGRRTLSLLSKAERRHENVGLSPAQAGPSVAARLRHLKELFAEGLITADDYATRRHAILAEV